MTVPPGYRFRRKVYGLSLWEDEVVSVIQAKIFIDGVHQYSLLIQGKLSSDYFPEHELIVYDHNEIAL